MIRLSRARAPDEVNVDDADVNAYSTCDIESGSKSRSVINKISAIINPT
jgi:hypothetical protein